MNPASEQLTFRYQDWGSIVTGSNQRMREVLEPIVLKLAGERTPLDLGTRVFEPRGASSSLKAELHAYLFSKEDLEKHLKDPDGILPQFPIRIVKPSDPDVGLL